MTDDEPDRLERMAEGSKRFQTTRWSLVLDASNLEAPLAGSALEQLCTFYWVPLYSYIRRQGHGPEASQDLTQEFFLRLIKTNLIASASREKGRFRSFLLIALKRFMINEWEKTQAKKRGGGISIISLNTNEAEALFLQEISSSKTADQIYDRHWAITLLDRVIDSLRSEFLVINKGDFFDALKVFLYGEQGDETHAALGARFQLSPSAIKAAVHRLRIRYRQRLREEVADTVSSPAEVDDELRHLLAVLSD